jgi:hypothetical protein
VVSVGALGTAVGLAAHGTPEEGTDVLTVPARVTQSSSLHGAGVSADGPAEWISDTVHTVDCTGTKACEGETIDCPPGLPCHIICDGLDACDDGVFNCPPGFPCTLSCEGKDACGDSNLNCDETAPCNIECGTDDAACEGATVNCGAGPCVATCNGSQAPTMKNCDKSSRCVRCGNEP